MAFSWQTFNKLQDDDLVTAMARRQADEEGRLKIIGAQNDLTTARANEDIRRDNAETNRVYREGLIEERGLARESADRTRRGEAEKLAQETAERTAIDERLADIMAHPEKYSPEEVNAARALRIGIKTGQLPRTTKSVWRADRQTDELRKLGDVDSNDVVQTEPAPSRVNVTMPGSQLSPSQYRTAVSDLHRQYMGDTATERTSLSVFNRAKSAWDLYKTKAGARDPGAQAVLIQFQKTLDPDSVVRESEYLRSIEGQPLASRLRAIWTQFNLGGPRVDDAGMQAYLNTMAEWAAQARKSHDVKVQRVGRVAQRFGIPLNEVVSPPFDVDAEQPPDPRAAAGAAAGAVRESAPATNAPRVFKWTPDKGVH